MKMPIYQKICQYLKINCYLVWSSFVFVLVQFLYSALLWQRDGLPPTPGDSLNYLTHLNGIVDSGKIYTIPNQTVHAGFNYFYALFSNTFNLQPSTTFLIFFFIGKIVLISILIYFLTGFFKSQKVIALIILLLAFFTGTGEVHGFFWVVPSFWSVAIFLLLVGMAKRKEPIGLIFLISILFLFIHPLSLYTLAVAFTYAVITSLVNKKISFPFLGLFVCLLLAALIQQGFLHYVDVATKSGSSSQSGRITELNRVVSETIIEGTDPHGSNKNLGPVLESNANASPATIGLLNASSVVEKVTNSESQIQYQNIQVPQLFQRLFPSITYFWNGYLFYWLFSIYLLPLYLVIIFMVTYLAIKHKLEATILFLTSLAAGFFATVHPQGFRFLVFTWPLTFVALVEVISYLNTKFKQARFFQTMAAAALIILMLFHLSYGVYFTHHTAQAQNYAWDRSCREFILDNTPEGTPVFYSDINLASTVFISEGLPLRPVIGIDQWNSYLEEYQVNQIVFIGDKDGSFLNNPRTYTKYQKKMAEILATRGHQVVNRSCGFFEINMEK